MKSTRRGRSTLAVEITDIQDCKISLRLDGREFDLAFDRFPWFKGATEQRIRNVRRPHARHLRWPDLDVDLDLESLEFPERYPLVSGQPGPTSKR